MTRPAVALLLYRAIGIEIDDDGFISFSSGEPAKMPKPALTRIKADLAGRSKTSKELAKHLGKTEATVLRWSVNDV